MRWFKAKAVAVSTGCHMLGAVGENEGLHMTSVQDTADKCRWPWWHGKSGLWCPIVHNACMRGPRGEAKANAINMHAMLSADDKAAA